MRFSLPASTCICALAILEAPLRARAEAPPVLDESGLVLLQPCLGSGPLADSINAYDTAQGIMIPFGELCRLLSFGILVDVERGKAEGFFISSERRFALDLDKGYAESEGRRMPIAPLVAVRYNREIFVDARLLEAWFPLEVKADLKGALLTIKSKEKLPIEEQWDREGRYARLSGPSGPSGDTPPPGEFLPDPYHFLDVPFVDLTATWGRSKNSGATKPQESLALAGDLLWMSSFIFINRDSEGHTGNSRYTLFREDPHGQLIGPMHAQRVELGNLLQSPSLDLAGDLPSGRGALVDNFPIGYRSRFATRSFQGRLPEGWTVELYQNSALTSVQRSRADGLYEFKDVPLRFGLNLFRFVFHGPQGQRREETYRADISNDLPAPGAFYYRFAGIKPKEETRVGALLPSQVQYEEAIQHKAALAEVDYGLTRTFALNTGFARAPLLDGLHDYTVAGVRGLFSYLSFQASAAQDRPPVGIPGLAAEAVVRTGYEFTSLSVRRSEFRRGFQKMGSLTSDNRILRTETVADVFGTVSVGQHPIGLSFTREEDLYADQGRISKDKLRATFSVTDITFSPSLARVKDSQQSGPTPLEADLFVTWFSSVASFQGEVSGRRTGSRNELLGWQALMDRTIPSGFTYRVGLKGQDSKPSHASLLAGINQTSGRFGYGVDMEYAKSSGYSISLRVQASFAREPRSGRWTSSAQSLSGMGAISAVAFLDANGNRKLDGGETVLEGTQFKSSGVVVESVIPDPKVTFKTSMPRAQEVPVQVDETSLEDPAMKPTAAIYRIVPRAGRVTPLDVPIAYFGEIVGTTRIHRQTGTADFGGVEIELLKASGESFRVLRTAYDGFFELRDLPLGEYILRVTPAEAARLRLKVPPPRSFRIDNVKNLFEGQNLVLEEPAPVALPVPSPTIP